MTALYFLAAWVAAALLFVWGWGKLPRCDEEDPR